MLLAQLTDTHIVDPTVDNPDMLADNNARLAAAVARLGRETVRPDAVLATGDLTDHGTELEMGLLAELLAPIDVPILAVPGNHDVRETFREGFDLPWASPDNLSWAIDVGELHVIGLDTTIPGSHAGLLDEERLAWFGDALAAAAGRRVLVAMHHPPFLSGVGWMDSMALRGIDGFAALVAGHEGVERILCGHLHRPMISTVGGVTASVGPSTIHHIELDLAPSAPVSVIDDPPGYHLHHDHGGQWVSHIRFFDTGNDPVLPTWSA